MPSSHIHFADAGLRMRLASTTVPQLLLPVHVARQMPGAGRDAGLHQPPCKCLALLSDFGVPCLKQGRNAQGLSLAAPGSCSNGQQGLQHVHVGLCASLLLHPIWDVRSVKILRCLNSRVAHHLGGAAQNSDWRSRRERFTRSSTTDCTNQI